MLFPKAAFVHCSNSAWQLVPILQQSTFPQPCLCDALHGLESGTVSLMPVTGYKALPKHLLIEGWGMDSKERQLTELLGLTARTLTHLTASMTSMSFELLRSEDEVTRNAGRRMIDRMATISSGLDEHWRLIGDLTGVHLAQEQIETVTEIQLQHKVVTPLGG
ncbi:hypothetical protein ALO77_04971 [Pseudomonas coronafaciens pv. garcae]|nr:hypothetical protein ALO77_04971 [Pseudomonas coronafaciens pv. garcae]